MNSDTEDLVHRFVDGDHAAFAELVRRFEKKVYGVAYRMMGNHLDADDVTPVLCGDFVVPTIPSRIFIGS